MILFALKIIFYTLLVLANAGLLLCTAYFLHNEKKKSGAVSTATKLGFETMICVYVLNIFAIVWGC